MGKDSDMKYLAMLGLLAVLVVGGTGCSALQKCGLCDSGCDMCGDGACMGDCMNGACMNGACQPQNGLGECYGGRGLGAGRGFGSRRGGPQSGTVAYPYYTTRGPRDYFACNPGYPSN